MVQFNLAGPLCVSTSLMKALKCKTLGAEFAIVRLTSINTSI